MKQYKGFLSCLVAAVIVALAVFALPTAVHAGTVSEPEVQTFTAGEYTYTVLQECATITACAPTVAGEVCVPKTLDGYRVVAIAENAFAGCNEITNLTVPDCVQSIGAAAFTGCSKLESVTLPFVGDSRKTAQDTYQYPLGYIFGTEYFGSSICAQQSYIGNRVGSASVGYYYIPTALTQVTITGGEIPFGAFEDCTHITTVILGDEVKSIGESAFDGCKNLTDLTIGNAVESIDYRVFPYCENLKSITIPASVRSITPGAFNGCSTLCAIWVSEDNATYSSDEFGVLYNKGKTQIVAVPAQMDSITIPESVQSIADYAFYHGVKDVFITDLYAWWKISFGENYADPLGEKTQMHVLDKNGEVIKDFVLDASVKTIPDKAFYNCQDMTGITISCNVKSIGEKAFYGCTGLTELILPDSVQTIGTYAFSGCTGLREFAIPDGVQTIEHYTFYGCTGITKVYFGNGVQLVEGYAFEQCRNLTEVHIDDMAAWCQIDFSGTEARPLQYGAGLYLNGELVTEVVIPKGVTAIGNMVFWHYTKLTEVTIPKGVKRIGDCAFTGCTGLTSVVIPESVQSIGDFAFSECTGLTSVSIPSSVKTIGVSAFAYCSSLITVEIPAGMTYISRDTFNACTSLYAVKIPKSVKEINSRAFKACDSLERVYYAGSEVNWENIYIWNANKCLTDATIYYNYKDSIELPRLAAPMVTIAHDEQSGIVTLAWDPVSSADRYEVWRATSKSGKYTKVTTVKGELWEENATAGKTYYYKIKAVNPANTSINSGFSNIVFVSVRCATPKLAVNTGSAGKPVLTWNKITGAKKYEIHRSINGGAFKKLTTVTKLTYTDTKATEGAQCTYKVKALGSSSSYNGNFSETGSCYVTCAAPALTAKVDTVSGKPTLSWKKITGAAGYAIYRSENGGAYQLLTTVTGVTYKDTATSADNQYSYYVITLGKAEVFNSVASTTKTVTVAVGQPRLTGTVNANGKPVITWAAVEDATSYKVYRATSSSSSKFKTPIETVTDLSYVDETVAAGKTYYYKVVAVGANSESIMSAYVKLTGKCATPEIFVEVNTESGKPVLSWEKIAGAKKYTVYRATSENGKYKSLGTTTKLTYTDTKAAAGTTYYYKVVANASSSKGNSGYSNVVSCSAKCSTPAVKGSVVASTGKPSLTWSKVTGAVNYEVYRDGQLLATVTGTSYVDMDAKTGETYIYTVKTLGKSEEFASALSKEVTLSATCAQPKLTGKIGQTGKPELNWNEVAEAECYVVYRSTSSSKGYKQIDETEDLTYTDTTASKGKTYYYKVVAVCGETESAQSSYNKLKAKK